MLDAPVGPSTRSRLPAATPDEVRWARVKASAARWFARLEAEEARIGRGRGASQADRAEEAPAAPDAGPAAVVETTPVPSRRRSS
jgi:hypothetical protein